MPYNKGDFTQQGVNGDVSALVRLNEKRVVKVVLSSDDESDNCDISGKVYDLLNGTSYDIGSGGGGGGGVPMCKLTVLADGANSTTPDPQTGSVVIYNNLLQSSSIIIAGDSIEIYSPYAYQNSTYIVSYFSVSGYNTEAEAIASVTNLNNISVLAYQTETEFWYIILVVTNPALPSSATIPCEPK